MNLEFLKEKFDLEGKVAVVTGASKGIGEAMADAFGACGAKVVISSRKQDALDALAESFRSKGHEVAALAANMGNPGEAEKLVNFTVEQFGGIDIVVNNAACNAAFGPVVNTESSAFDKIINVNVKAVFEMAKYAYPYLKESSGASVINISSVGGITPEPGIGIYNVSKAAVISLSKVLAKEWGRDGIRVNAICPGLIKTKMSEALWSNEEIVNGIKKTLPLGRIGNIEELQGLALLLATEAGSYMTGGAYTVDGGFTI